jgi:hypothetical protein
MLAELDVLKETGERTTWALGALTTVLGLRLRTPRTPIWLAGVAAASALLCVLDWSPSDIANQATLLALVLAAGCLGFAVPGARLATGLVLGSVVAVAHVAYVLLGVRLPYSSHPAGLLGALSLLVLTVPSTIAALVAGGIRHQTLPGGH